MVVKRGRRVGECDSCGEGGERANNFFKVVNVQEADCDDELEQR
jgi:hypothetical protein